MLFQQCAGNWLVTAVCLVHAHTFLANISNSVVQNEIHTSIYRLLHVLAVHQRLYLCESWCHHELLLLCVVSCRKRIIMNEKHLIPCGQETIYPAMKPYFVKHCSPSCDEQCQANVSHYRCESWRSNLQGFTIFFVQCTVFH